MTEATYDVKATPKKDMNILLPDNQETYQRLIRMMVNNTHDADGLGILLEMEAMLKEKISARIAELNAEGISYADLAAGTSMTGAGLNYRVNQYRKSQEG